MSDLPDKREVFKHFCEEAYIHGPRLIYHNQWQCPRIFWIVIQILACILAGYQLGSLFTTYFASPTVTRIQERHQWSISMPNITVCVLQQINKTKLMQVVNTGNEPSETAINLLSSLLYSPFSLAYSEQSYVKNTLIPAVKFTGEQNSKLPFVNYLRSLPKQKLYELLEHVTLDCDPMFTYFMANLSTNMQFCQSFRRFVSENGPCFVLNNPPAQRYPGSLGGISFAYVHPAAHILASSSLSSFMEKSIHLYMSPEDASLSPNPIYIPIGYYSHVELEKQEHIRFASRHCTNKPNYHETECASDCMNDITRQYCGCVPYNTLLNINTSIAESCELEQSLNCWISSSAEGFLHKVMNCRSQRCLPRCSYNKYEAFISTAPLDATIFPPRFRDWPAGTTFVDIYYSDLVVTRIEEVITYSPNELFSNIGGTLSLYNGSSVISTVQILAFFIMLTYYNCCRCCGKAANRVGDSFWGWSPDGEVKRPVAKVNGVVAGHHSEAGLANGNMPVAGTAWAKTDEENLPEELVLEGQHGSQDSTKL